MKFMKILVVNAGSSSLKFQVIDTVTTDVLGKGNFERIGEEEAFLTHKVNGTANVIKKAVKDALREYNDENFKR